MQFTVGRTSVVEDQGAAGGVFEDGEDTGDLGAGDPTVDAPKVDTEDVRDAQDLDKDLEALDDRTICIASLEPRSRVRRRDTIELAVDIERVHVFDISSGEAIY